VEERCGLVWLCLGDPVVPLPDVAEWGADGFDVAIHEPRHTTVSAGQLVDNFLDATHLATVHAGTFGVTDDPTVPPFDVERNGWLASSECTLPYQNHDDPLVATGEHPLVQPQVLFKQVLGPTTALVRLGFPLTGRTIVFLFACTPETRDRTRLFKLMARDDFDGDAARMAEALAFEDRVLDEDLVVLEAYDEMGLALDLRTEVHTRADKLSVAYRRLLADLVGASDGAGG
jgi:vanillate O-demethylase monooxygenase subunit